MTTAAIVIAFLAIVSALVYLMYMQFFGFDRTLRSRLRARLQPQEVAIFESWARGGPLSVPSFFLSAGQGYLIVTAHRLLFGRWMLPPFWQTIKEIPLADIDEVTSLHMFTRTQVIVKVKGGKKIGLLPGRYRGWPFGKDIGPQLLESIERGRAANA